MSLEQICADLRASQRRKLAEQLRRERQAMAPSLRRIIQNNARREPGSGELGGIVVFASYVERRTYKRIAAEKLYLLRLHRTGNYGPGGWEKLFAQAQTFRRLAQECRP